jgi:hypothetical protein
MRAPLSHGPHRTPFAAAGARLALVAGWALAIATLTVAAGWAAEARVSYLSGGTVYLDAGRDAGLAEGDTVTVSRDGKVVARLRVAALSSQRASCDTLAVLVPLRVGDAASFTARAVPPVAAALPDTGVPPVTPTSRTSSRRIHGRVGARFLNVDHQEAGDYQLPQLDLRLDAAGLGAGHVDLAADIRARRITRTTTAGGSSSDDDGRVYRLSAAVHDPRDAWRLTVGRQISPFLASVSLFDGVLAQVGRERWGVGAFAGAQPEPASLGLSDRILQAGGYAEWRSPRLAERRWSATLGGAHSTDDGEVNRDFLFAQGFYRDRRLSGWFAQEVDLNAAWKQDQGDPAVSWTSTYLSARAELTRALVIHGGYDNRRSVRLYRDRETPETEFDDHYRQGVWGGMSLEPGGAMRLGGEWRTTLGGPEPEARSWSATAETWRGLPLRGRLRARWSDLTSDALHSTLLALGAGFDLHPSAHVEIAGGTRGSEDRASGTRTDATWESLDLDVTLGRHWLLTGSVENVHGDVERLLQEYVGLSWRF